MAELLTGIKESEPRLTVKAVIRQAHDSGQLPDGLRLAHSTVNRLLKQAGLMDRTDGQPAVGDLRRFNWPLANDLWQESERSDSCHYGNPAVMGPRPRNPHPAVVLSPDRSP